MGNHKHNEIVKKCKEYYKSNPTGGNLHILLDDGNIETPFVAYCYKRAILENDEKGEELALAFLELTEKERYIICGRYDEYCR